MTTTSKPRIRWPRRAKRPPFGADGTLTEAARQKAIIELLHLHGFSAHRRNVGAKSGITATGKRFFMRFGEQKGASDITGTIPGSGRRLEIEVKTESGQATSMQMHWIDYHRRMGAVAFVARSRPDCERQLRMYLTADELAKTLDRRIGTLTP